MISGSAPGKVILFGEHAVVYGRPAIALPLPQIRASAEIAELDHAAGDGILLSAPQIGLHQWLHEMAPDAALGCAVRLTLDKLGVRPRRPLRLDLHSGVPIAAGLGSGAAVSVAIIRALSAYWQMPLSPADQSALAYEVEKIHHGNPSGIDNTVVAFEEPVFFVRGKPAQLFAIRAPFRLLIADSGDRVSTAQPVGELRRRWQADPAAHEAVFDEIQDLALAGRQRIEAGQVDDLGSLMNHNHQLLQLLGVSSPKLDQLVQAAQTGGALGAKLTGGGLGGMLIALVKDAEEAAVTAALIKAGAVQVLQVEVGK